MLTAHGAQNSAEMLGTLACPKNRVQLVKLAFGQFLSSLLNPVSFQTPNTTAESLTSWGLALVSFLLLPAKVLTDREDKLAGKTLGFQRFPPLGGLWKISPHSPPQSRALTRPPPSESYRGSRCV